MGIACVIQLRDGRLLSAGADKTMCVWETETAQCTHSVGVHPLAPVGEDERAALLNDELRYPLIDERLEKEPRSAYHWASVTALYEMKNGTLATGSADRTVRLWDLSTLKKVFPCICPRDCLVDMD